MTKHWFIAHLIDKYTWGGKFGVDIGVGADNWSEFKHCKMLGIDRQQSCKPDIVVELENYMPFKHDIFDVGIAINSLNYIENPRQTLKEIYRILKVGATLVCVVDNEKSSSHPHVWEQKYLDRVLQVTGFRSILSKNLKDYLFAKWYNKTSVYAFAVVKKSKIKKESEKYCIKCGKTLMANWKEDEAGRSYHSKCPIEKPIEYAKSYNIETTHPEN